MENLNCPTLVPVEMPVGLTHLDSDLCWCDPIAHFSSRSNSFVKAAT